MLVLSRKLGERICIGDNICITVVDIDRGKIRLGIEAPREVPVFRQELLPADKSGSLLHPETRCRPRLTICLADVRLDGLCASRICMSTFLSRIIAVPLVGDGVFCFYRDTPVSLDGLCATIAPMAPSPTETRAQPPIRSPLLLWTTLPCISIAS